MTIREGSLEAPTRHPLDWKSAEFYDQEKLDAELHRVFDICHGCRRCVSLCGSFPTLFDLVDEGPTGEVDGVDKKDYWKVVDQCYLCDLCYLTKCPYVPPHEWNLDFPHTMLRAKSIKFQRGEVSTGEKFLASTDTHGSFAGIPIVTDTERVESTLSELVDTFVAALRDLGAHVETGRFGADMDVALVNHGPVTLMLEV